MSARRTYHGQTQGLPLQVTHYTLLITYYYFPTRSTLLRRMQYAFTYNLHLATSFYLHDTRYLILDTNLVLYQIQLVITIPASSKDLFII